MSNNTTEKKAVVFDLDGTLLYTLEDLKNATNYALKQNGMPERTLDEVRRFVGNGVKLLMERAVPQGDRKSTRLNSSHSGQSRMPSSA